MQCLLSRPFQCVICVHCAVCVPPAQTECVTRCLIREGLQFTGDKMFPMYSTALCIPDAVTVVGGMGSFVRMLSVY